MKSEPDVFSIDDLRKKKTAGWDGVRNYQARNPLKEMRAGDQAFFYHSSTAVPAIVGVMEIVREAYPDRSATEDPRWVQVDVRYKLAFKRPLSLESIRHMPPLRRMKLLTNSRLSVQPVTPAEWDIIFRQV